jgi:Ca-activated chloride channel family protein
MKAALLCALFLMASPVLADDGFGTIRGHVIHSGDRGVISGVLITVTSRSLMGEVVVVSDENGFYWVPQLPPGRYTLRYESDSGIHHTAWNIPVRINRTQLLNVEIPAQSWQMNQRFVGVPCGLPRSHYSRPPPGP